MSSLLDGLLGSSRRGDFRTLSIHLNKLIQKLPGEIRSGGQNAILATLQTLSDIFLNMSRTVRRGSAGNLNPILASLQNIVEILQENSTNVGAKATLTSVIIQLQTLQQTARANGKQVATVLKNIRLSLDAVVKGLQSKSPLGGMTSDRDALQNVFIIFQMITTNVQSGNTAQVGSLLKQLQYLLAGLGE